MVELLLTRFSSGKEATLGNLFNVMGTEELQFLCYTLEDQYQDVKVAKETRIPAGRYQIKLRDEGGMTQRYAKRFDFHRGMLHLQDVPNFKYIYIHTGNTDDHTDGCILVGDGQVSNVIDRGQVTTSVAAYRRLYETILGALSEGDVWIRIGDVA